MKIKATSQEILAHLTRFIEDPEEVTQMTPAAVEAALQAEGVDVEPGLQRLRQRLAAIRALPAERVPLTDEQRANLTTGARSL